VEICKERLVHLLRKVMLAMCKDEDWDGYLGKTVAVSSYNRDSFTLGMGSIERTILFDCEL
jgi:hypothetical protein